MKKFAFLSLAALALTVVAPVLADDEATSLADLTNSQNLTPAAPAAPTTPAENFTGWKGTTTDDVLGDGYTNGRNEITGAVDGRGRVSQTFNNLPVSGDWSDDQSKAPSVDWSELNIQYTNIFASADAAYAYANRQANGRTVEVKPVFQKGVEYWYVVFGAKPAAAKADDKDDDKASAKKDAKKVEAAKTATSGSGKALPKTSAAK